MPFLNVRNRAESTVVADITSTANSLSVAAGHGGRFPDSNFHITIQDEILLCTSRSTDTFTVTRAREGTTAAAHSAGAKVELRITAKIIEDLNAFGDSLASTNWTPVTFEANWSNFGGEYQTVQFKKFGDLVFIRGLATSGAAAWSAQPTIFTLPVGFRPLSRLMFAVIGSNALARLEIISSGEVQWSTVGAGSDWISLDGIVFSVD